MKKITKRDKEIIKMALIFIRNYIDEFVDEYYDDENSLCRKYDIPTDVDVTEVLQKFEEV